MAMDCKDGESPGPRQKNKSLPGHDIFCTPENSNFLSETPYSALDPTRREIRLLKVLPDSNSGFVECELLPSAPIAELRGKYLALSYCAGNPRNTKIILVNGVKCNVFANLCHALTCARHFWTTEPRNGDFLLWADQICINQADLSERSHQVGFMRDIYESAQQTLICLSTSDTEGKGMEWLVETYHAHKGPDGLWAYNPWHDSNEMLKTGRAAFWKEIVESPWWNRAWVFQEFMVSTDATFLSGHYQISWEEAWLVLELFIDPNNQPELEFDLESTYQRQKFDLDFTYQKQKFDLKSDFQRRMRRPYVWDDDDDYVSRMAEETAGKAWFMLKTKAEWKGDVGSLTFLLARSRNSRASDGRDRIYAFLGLADPGYAITPDYSTNNTLCQVLAETTKNIILFENSLHVLSVLDTPPLARRPGLPSWAVDWTREGIARSLNTMDIYEIECPARGNGQAIASFQDIKHPETLQTMTVMEVTGIYVKDVESAELGSSFLRPTKSEVLEIWNLFGSSREFILRRESYGYRIIRWINFYDLEGGLDLTTESASTEAEESRVITIF